MCVKKLVKMGLSEGGGVQLDVFLNRGGGGCYERSCEKNICIGLVGRGLLLMVVCISVLEGV